jgi:hypothetical protein
MKKKNIFAAFSAALFVIVLLLLFSCDVPAGNQPAPEPPPRAAVPAANPPPGGYELGTPVTLTTETEGAAIYYTTDGTDPSVSEDLRYTAPILIILANGQTLRIRAIAAKEGMAASDIVEAAYTLPGLQGTVTILGEPEGGHILRVRAELPGEADEGKITYQWLRGETADAVNEPIKDATGETYTLVPIDEGMYITVSVTRDSVNEGAVYAVPALIRPPSLYWTLIPGGEGPGESGFGDTAVHSIVFANGKYIAVGAGGKIAWSEDGLAWTAVRPGLASGTTRFPTTAVIHSVAFGNGRFVAGGDGGIIAYSANGITWTGIDPGNDNNTTTTFSVSVRRIVYDDGKFFAVANGSGNVALSDNGARWTRLTLSRNLFNCVAYGNGTWVVAGRSSSGAVFSCSGDGGKSWAETSQAQTLFPNSSPIYALAFGDGNFVAAGGRGRMAWSEDGVTWTAIPPGAEDDTSAAFDNSNINGIAWGAGKWIAVGAAGKMARSEDGVHWSAVPPGTGSYTAAFGTSAILGVTFCNGRFYAVGENGKMAYSNQLTSSD